MCRRRNAPYATSYTLNSTTGALTPTSACGYQRRQQSGCCGQKRARRQARREAEALILAQQINALHLDNNHSSARTKKITNTTTSTSSSSSSSSSSSGSSSPPPEIHLTNHDSGSGNEKQVIFVPVPTYTRQRGRGPVGAMAGLLLGGISLGAQKYQAHREKKKAAKQALAYEGEGEQSTGVLPRETRREREQGNVTVVDERQRGMERGRGAELGRQPLEGRSKSEEAREDARGEGRRSTSAEREAGGEAPPSYEPPSYETAVGESSAARRT